MEWKCNGALVFLFLGISSTIGFVVDSNSVDQECHSLPSTLKDEIKSYEGIAARIIKEIVEGKFAGVTYNR